MAFYDFPFSWEEQFITTDELIFSRGVDIPLTRYIYIYNWNWVVEDPLRSSPMVLRFCLESLMVDADKFLLTL